MATCGRANMSVLRLPSSSSTIGKQIQKEIRTYSHSWSLFVGVL